MHSLFPKHKHTTTPHTHTHLHIYTHIHACRTHTHTHTYTHIHSHAARTHTHIYIYIYTHVRTYIWIKHLIRSFTNVNTPLGASVVSSDTRQNASVSAWRTFRLVGETLLNESFDGTHYPINSQTHYWQSQMVLNLLCNDHVNFADGTCCKTSWPSLTWIAAVMTFRYNT